MRPARLLSLLARTATVLALAGLSGCDRAPELDTEGVLSGAGAFPPLKPLDDLAAPAGQPVLTDDDAAALRARAAALKRRGSALVGTEAADPETRARLDAAIAARGN